MGRAYGHDSGQGRGFETSRPVFSVLSFTLSSASISVSTSDARVVLNYKHLAGAALPLLV